nr:MAG TPA: hypothetical protein [Inoviridae sp.]
MISCYSFFFHYSKKFRYIIFHNLLQNIDLTIDCSKIL